MTTSTSPTHVQWHFAIPVFAKLLENAAHHQTPLIQLMNDRRAQSPGIAKSNLNGWHSETNFHLINHAAIHWLNQEIGSMAEDCIATLHPELKNFSIVMETCWANILGHGGWNAPHNHYPAQWSGVYYVDAEKQSQADTKKTNQKIKTAVKDGKIDFLNPIPIAAGFGLPSSVSYTPKNGQMLIFPAMLQHMVHPHFKDTERYSIAFNLNIVHHPPVPLAQRAT